MRGHLVLADISGYTRFLNESELEHANGIINELLEAVIGAIQVPLKVSSIEGDAVFMYGSMPEGTSGQTILESVELLYCEFAAALETMVINTTCSCNACANITGLGMKIVMHCGEFVKSELAGRETLTGPDVIIAHRLLKNSVVEKTDIADYMLVTQACVDELDVEAIVASWVPHTEAYDDIGEIEAYVSSLPDVWAYVRSQREDKVLERDAILSLSKYSQAPPGVVWDYMIDPLKRLKWNFANSMNVEDENEGRIATGTSYHCAHGDNEMTIFTVTDIKTFDYVTYMFPLLSHGLRVRFTDYLVPSGTGTRIITHLAPPFDYETGSPAPEEVAKEVAKFLVEGYGAQLDALIAMADEASETLVNA